MFYCFNVNNNFNSSDEYDLKKMYWSGLFEHCYFLCPLKKKLSLAVFFCLMLSTTFNWSEIVFFSHSSEKKNLHFQSILSIVS